MIRNAHFELSYFYELLMQNNVLAKTFAKAIAKGKE